MPQLTERARLLLRLRGYLRLLDYAADIDSADEEEADEAADALRLVDSFRYLSRERSDDDKRARNSFRRCEDFLSDSDSDFKRAFRVTHAQFDFLVDLIGEDEVFRPLSTRGRPSAPIRHQLLLVLWRLAHSGTGATVFQIAARFGVAEGTVILWTDRVLCALVAVERQFVWWPERGERQQLRQELSDEHGLAGCIGFVDGTHINLASAPARHDAADFFNRHHRHSFNLLAVVDQQRRFRFLHLGFPGSAHDQRVYRASALAQAPDAHFDADEFILGDSGYTCDAHLVSLFRRHRGQECLDPNQIAFNRHASPRRVAVEHAFDVLKLRWQSLRALPVSLRGATEEARAACWIRACVVLHNALLEDGAAPGLWLTAAEREEAQRLHGADFSRWEQEGEAELEGVGLEEKDEEEETTAGVELRLRVQTFASMWRQQREAW